MTSYRTYSAVDAVNGESTFSAAKKHNARFADVQSWFPSTSGAAQYQAMLLGSGLTGFTFSHVLRSDAAVNLSGVGSLANGDMLYFNGTNLVRIAAGTSGQLLQSAGAASPTWVSSSLPSPYTEKTANFNVADNGRFACDTSGGAFNAVLTYASNSVDDEFIITPTPNSDFSINPVTIIRNGSEEIAGVAADFICDVNAEYHFRGDPGGNWSIDIKGVLR